MVQNMRDDRNQKWPMCRFCCQGDVAESEDVQACLTAVGATALHVSFDSSKPNGTYARGIHTTKVRKSNGTSI